MAKIFITGISSELMKQFVAELDKYEISGLSRSKFSLKNVKIIEGDLLHLEPWVSNLENADILIHAAAITHSFDKKKYFDINFEASKRLIDAAKKANVKKFVYISTRTACPNSGAYGLSKLATENYLKSTFENYLILKPSEIFGGLKNEGIDKIIDDAKHKKFMACPVGLEAPLVPVHVGDVIKLMQKYILEESSELKKIIINGPKRFTVYELIKEVNLLSQNKTIILPIPKWFMYLVKNIFSITGLNVGFVPDQVDRLYCQKEIAKIDFPFLGLEEYLKKKNG